MKSKNLSKQKFERLLFAAFNISEFTECGSKAGEQTTEGALKAKEALFDIMERSKNHKDGVILVARLITECFLAKDPSSYAEIEADRGLDGDRHEFDGATINFNMAMK